MKWADMTGRIILFDGLQCCMYRKGRATKLTLRIIHPGKIGLPLPRDEKSSPSLDGSAPPAAEEESITMDADSRWPLTVEDSLKTVADPGIGQD